MPCLRNTIRTSGGVMGRWCAGICTASTCFFDLRSVSCFHLLLSHDASIWCHLLHCFHLFTLAFTCFHLLPLCCSAADFVLNKCFLHLLLMLSCKKMLLPIALFLLLPSLCSLQLFWMAAADEKIAPHKLNVEQSIRPDKGQRALVLGWLQCLRNTVKLPPSIVSDFCCWCENCSS